MYRLFSHNDLDGVGCGIVAKLAFGDNVEIRYNSIAGLDMQVERFFEGEKEDKKEDFVLITDLSIHEENAKRVDRFVQEGGNAKLIDHHKTALHFNEYPWGMVRVQYDDGRLTSATSLLYDYLLQMGIIKPKKSLEEFVELVRQYDTWEWDLNNNVKAKQLNDLFFLISIDEFEEKMVARITSAEHFDFDDFEKKLLEMEEAKIERYIKRKKRDLIQTFIGKHCVGIVHAESYHSELGNDLGKEYPHLDYISILNMSGKKISFRTIHDHIDVSKVAGEFNGGGHAKASGCPMTKEAFRLFVTEVFDIEPLRADSSRNYFNLKGLPDGSLYENRNKEKFYIFESDDHKWIIQKDDQEMEKSFSSFLDAESYIKRLYGAWLVKDEILVKFLKERFLK